MAVYYGDLITSFSKDAGLFVYDSSCSLICNSDDAHEMASVLDGYEVENVEVVSNGVEMFFNIFLRCDGEPSFSYEYEPIW